MTKIVGILNLTPDSFSDGGEFFSIENALQHYEELCQIKSDIIDIGAESTRPNAKPITQEEEWNRLASVLEIILQKPDRPLISIDTYHPKTAQKALEMGADWINDVSGFDNPAMIEAVRGYNSKLVLMHSTSVPANPANNIPQNCDPVVFLANWMKRKAEQMTAYGINKNRLIFDVGIGFGKNAQQSLELIKRAEELQTLGYEILYGHSRKSFLKLFTNKDPAERDVETAILSFHLAMKKVDYLRVHNAFANMQAIKIAKEMI